MENGARRGVRGHPDSSRLSYCDQLRGDWLPTAVSAAADGSEASSRRAVPSMLLICSLLLLKLLLS